MTEHHAILYPDRWRQQDSIAGSISNPAVIYCYAYADDDPVNLTDASGQSATGCGIALFAAAGDTTGVALGVADKFAPLADVLVGVGGVLAGASFVASVSEDRSPQNAAVGGAFLVTALTAGALSVVNPLIGVVNIELDAYAIKAEC